MKQLSKGVLLIGGGFDLYLISRACILELDHTRVITLLLIGIVAFSLGEQFEKKFSGGVPFALSFLSFVRFWVGWQVVVPLWFLLPAVGIANGLLITLWSDTHATFKRASLFWFFVVLPPCMGTFLEAGTYWLAVCFVGACLALTHLGLFFFEKMDEPCPSLPL